MSADMDVAVRGTITAGGPGLRTRASRAVRSAALWVIAAVLVLVVAIVTVLMQGREAVRPLHFDSTQADGGRAFIEVLRTHGRDVETTESLDDARAAAAAGGTLLVYAASGDLADEVPGELVESAESAGTDIAVIAPGEAVADWTSELEARTWGDPAPVPRRAPDCEAQAPNTAGAVSARNAGPDYAAVSSEPGDAFEFCYPGADTGAVDDIVTAHGLLVSEERDSMTLTVLGAEEWFENRTLADEGHMSLLAGALTGDDPLTYYYPDPEDQPGADEAEPLTGGLLDLVPGWALMSLLWLLPVGVIAMFVYGRRLGPLAVEPLPVVVPAAETVLGRSALLQRSRDRETALSDLRTAALVRIGRRLALGPEVPAAEVAARAAASSGLDPAWTQQVLLLAPVPDDSALVRLSADITLIEREVDTL